MSDECKSRKAGLKPGYKALRRYRFSTENQIYLVPFNTASRQVIFSNNHHAANAFCKALNDKRLWPDAKLMCWVLMPDHVHLLIQLGATESMSALINCIKTNTARRINECLQRRGKLWGDGFHDKALKYEENLVDVARYIVMNPIRAELVKRIGDYPYWNAIWLE
jgi:putative transposase